MKNTRDLLPEWVKEGLITPEQARNIDQWLLKRNSGGPSVLVILSIIGALLTGIGIILIVAHNWDYLPHAVRLAFAMLPSVVFTALKLYALFRKPESAAWRESSSLLQILSFGASISLLSQIYQLGGSLESFLVSWLALATPTLFYGKSSSALPLYLVLATWFVLAAGFNHDPAFHPAHYLWMLGCIFWCLWIKNKLENALRLFQLMSWLLPVSIALAISTLIRESKTEEIAFLMYTAYAALLMVAGQLAVRWHQGLTKNGFNTLGRLGIIILLILMSYKFYWKLLDQDLFEDWQFAGDPMFFLSLIFWLSALLLSAWLYMRKQFFVFPEFIAAISVFVLSFILGKANPVAGMLAVNSTLLLIGVYYIRTGVRNGEIIILNYGFLWISLFLICRFFDFDVSFLVRGLFFVAIGLIFFGINYLMANRKKDKNEQ